MHYESASVDEITKHFRTITRQRIHQIIQKHTERGQYDVVVKMQQAKAVLKIERNEEKRGCTQAEYDKIAGLWAGIKQRVSKNVAYLGCTIQWDNEAQFRQWCLWQIGFMVENFELDKDLLIKGNRIYGPDTCVFIPYEINILLSGTYRSGRRGKYPIGVTFNKGSGSFVAQMSDAAAFGLNKYLGSFPTVEEAFACYKAAKETRIRRLAGKWKDQIDPRAYEALLSRTVELDD